MKRIKINPLQWLPTVLVAAMVLANLPTTHAEPIVIRQDPVVPVMLESPVHVSSPIASKLDVVESPRIAGELEAQPEDNLTEHEREIYEQALVCYHEASRSRADCLGIRQVATRIRGCVNAQGQYTRCFRPHVRRETTMEALRRHSGRVLGLRETTNHRTLLVRGFRYDARTPASFTESEWAAVRPYWLRVLEWAREAVEDGEVACPENPITWGGAMDTEHPKARNLVPIRCGDTSNIFYVPGPVAESEQP